MNAATNSLRTPANTLPNNFRANDSTKLQIAAKPPAGKSAAFLSADDLRVNPTSKHAAAAWLCGVYYSGPDKELGRFFWVLKREIRTYNPHLFSRNSHARRKFALEIPDPLPRPHLAYFVVPL